MLRELLEHPVRIGFRLIHLVYGYYYLNIRRFRVAYSLDCLRHNTVVRRNNKDGNISCHSAALAH